MQHPLEAIDYTEEDFGLDEKLHAMGFVGELSERSWLYKLKRDLDQGKATAVGENAKRSSLCSVNYFQDDSEFPFLEAVDLSGRPPQHIADQLIDCYFQTVHPAFPVIERSIFLRQYQSFYSKSNVPLGKRWLAIFNLIIAISARHLLLIGNQSSGEHEHDEHMVYFSRSWGLGLSSNTLLNHPNLQQVQVEALTALYLLSVGQPNRSSRLNAVAIRSAVAMGLSRSKNDLIGTSTETPHRVWWGLFMLDTVLCVITGRPPSAEEAYCIAPLPVPYDQEGLGDNSVVQPKTELGVRNTSMTSAAFECPATLAREKTTGCLSLAQHGPRKGKASGESTQGLSRIPVAHTSYFLYMLNLAFIQREVINAVYAPGATRRPWPEIEMAIFEFNNEADNWFSHLPAEFHLTDLDDAGPFVLQHAGLAFQFYTTKLIILQPCLSRLTQLSSPSSVCETMAAMCVQIAGQMIDLLPDKVEVGWLFKVTPWWCILHYFMQSTSVLLTALFNRDKLGISVTINIGKKVEKVIRWLGEMSTKDPSSRQAWLVCKDVLSGHCSNLGLEVDDGL